MTSKYLNPPQPPLTFTSTPDFILSEVKKALAHQKQVLENVVATVTPETATWANVMEPILQAENTTREVTDYLCFYKDVSPDEKVNKASSDASQLAESANIESSTRADVFQLVDAVHKIRDTLSLEPEQKHIIEKMHKEYLKNGIHVPPGPKKDRVETIRKTISALSNKVNENAVRDKSGIWLKKEDFDGVDPSVLDVESLEKGEGKNEGKVFLTFKYDQSPRFMKYAHNAEMRKKVAIAQAGKVRRILCLSNYGGIFVCLHDSRGNRISRL